MINITYIFYVEKPKIDSERKHMKEKCFDVIEKFWREKFIKTQTHFCTFFLRTVNKGNKKSLATLLLACSYKNLSRTEWQLVFICLIFFFV